MDTITIEDLEVFYHIGVSKEERTAPQKLHLSIDIAHDVTAAATADDLSETIDYDALSRRLLSFGKDRYWRLIETLAVDIANLILNEFHARKATVEVKKFCLPHTRHVAVRVQRTKSQNQRKD